MKTERHPTQKVEEKMHMLRIRSEKLKFALERYHIGTHGGIVKPDWIRRRLLNNERLGIDYATTINALRNDKDLVVFLDRTLEGLAATGDPLSKKLIKEYETHECFKDSEGLKEVVYKIVARRLTEQEYNAYLNRYYGNSDELE